MHRNCVFESTGGLVFEGNFAGRDGGAIAAAADDGNRIDIRADIVFGESHGNVAAGNGGAIALAAGSELRTEDSLSVFSRENVLLCDPTLDLPPNQYATMFEDNLSTEGAGGVFFVTGENARVLIEQAAIIGNDATIPGDEGAPQGSVAIVANGGLLSIHNSLIWANGSRSIEPLKDPPTLLQAKDAGSRISLSWRFNLFRHHSQ